MCVMVQAFRAFTRDTHAFEGIKVKAATAMKFTKRQRQLWAHDEEEDTYMLESVPFTHASEKLTADNKAYNALYERLVRRQWKASLAEARRRMVARVSGWRGRG